MRAEAGVQAGRCPLVGVEDLVERERGEEEEVGLGGVKGGEGEEEGSPPSSSSDASDTVG